jgi:hypothetical protein
LNYRIVWSIDSSAASEAFKMRLRVSGSDNTSTNYNWIRGATGQGGALSASGSGTSANDTSWDISAVSGTRTSQVAMDVFRPFDSDFTGYTGNWGYFDSISNFYGGFNNGSSSVTTSYTGFTFFPNSGTITGSVRVYGYAN